MFYLNSTLNFGIPLVLVLQTEVYYKVDRLITGLTTQQKVITARWYSYKTSLNGLFSEAEIQLLKNFIFKSTVILNGKFAVLESNE